MKTKANEIDDIILANRQNNSITVNHHDRHRRIWDIAKDNNSHYLELITIIESRMSGYIDSGLPLDDIDLRRMLGEISVNDLDLLHGNSNAGILAKEILNTYDIINGEPEQSQRVKSFLENTNRKILNLNCQSDIIQIITSKLKDCRGNDVDLILKEIIHDNDTFGYVSKLSNDAECRKSAFQIYRKIHDVLSEVSLPSIETNLPTQTSFKIDENCHRAILQKNRIAIDEISKRLCDAKEVRVSLEKIKCNVESSKDEPLRHHSVKRSIKRIENILTYLYVGNKMINDEVQEALYTELDNIDGMTDGCIELKSFVNKTLQQGKSFSRMAVEHHI